MSQCYCNATRPWLKRRVQALKAVHTCMLASHAGMESQLPLLAQHVGAKLDNRSPLSLKPLTCVDSRLYVPDSEMHNSYWKNTKANHADRVFSTVLPVCIRSSETCRVQMWQRSTLVRRPDSRSSFSNSDCISTFICINIRQSHISKRS
jgi:hypothetical protein